MMAMVMEGQPKQEEETMLFSIMKMKNSNLY